MLIFFFFLTFKDILLNNSVISIYLNKINSKNIKYFKNNDLLEISFSYNYIYIYLTKLHNTNNYLQSLKKKNKFINSLIYKKNLNYKKIISLLIYLNINVNCLYSFDYKTFSIYINNFFIKDYNKYNFNLLQLTDLTQLLNWRYIN